MYCKANEHVHFAFDACAVRIIISVLIFCITIQPPPYTTKKQQQKTFNQICHAFLLDYQTFRYSSTEYNCKIRQINSLLPVSIVTVWCNTAQSPLDSDPIMGLQPVCRFIVA